MTIHYQDDQVTLHAGDCIEVLATLPESSVDSIVCDPPYGLEFMGNDWDAPWKATDTTAAAGRATRGAVVHDPATERGGFQDGNGGNPYSRSRVEYGRGGAASVSFQTWCAQWAAECLRVLKPGGHLLAFGGTRTYHRLAAGIEDAGFEIRDSLAWLYGSGFPKSLDVSKSIDKAAGAAREVVSTRERAATGRMAQGEGGYAFGENFDVTAPATDEAKQWHGWGTALKPAFEPIVCARKAFRGTVAANVVEHGTGALNIDACRVGDDERTNPSAGNKPGGASLNMSVVGMPQDADARAAVGRWPSNVLLDESSAQELDRQSGVTRDGIAVQRNGGGQRIFNHGDGLARPDAGYGGAGGASRFFPVFRYTAKAGGSERPSANGVSHPTVKPLDMMRWLVRLVTPPGGTVLDPFAGSGTTAEACIHEHLHCITIEREPDYLPLIVARLSKPMAIGFNFEAEGA